MPLLGTPPKTKACNLASLARRVWRAALFGAALLVFLALHVFVGTVCLPVWSAVVHHGMLDNYGAPSSTATTWALGVALAEGVSAILLLFFLLAVVSGADRLPHARCGLTAAVGLAALASQLRCTANCETTGAGESNLLFAQLVPCGCVWQPLATTGTAFLATAAVLWALGRRRRSTVATAAPPAADPDEATPSAPRFSPRVRLYVLLALLHAMLCKLLALGIWMGFLVSAALKQSLGLRDLDANAFLGFGSVVLVAVALASLLLSVQLGFGWSTWARRNMDEGGLLTRLSSFVSLKAQAVVEDADADSGPLGGGLSACVRAVRRALRRGAARTWLAYQSLDPAARDKLGVLVFEAYEIGTQFAAAAADREYPDNLWTMRMGIVLLNACLSSLVLAWIADHRVAVAVDFVGDTGYLLILLRVAYLRGAQLVNRAADGVFPTLMCRIVDLATGVLKLGTFDVLLLVQTAALMLHKLRSLSRAVARKGGAVAPAPQAKHGRRWSWLEREPAAGVQVRRLQYLATAFGAVAGLGLVGVLLRYAILAEQCKQQWSADAFALCTEIYMSPNGCRCAAVVVSSDADIDFVAVSRLTGVERFVAANSEKPRSFAAFVGNVTTNSDSLTLVSMPFGKLQGECTALTLWGRN